jgi:succinylglutamic semialdehyde dehydrogenase
MKKGQLFIDGQWCKGGGAAFDSINPAISALTDEPVWSGNGANSLQVNAAVKAARRAFPDWSSRTVEQRLAVIQNYAQLLEDNQQVLSRIISDEVGKPRWEAMTEVSAMVGKVAISIEAYHQRTGEHSSLTGSTTQSLRHKPHGVLAVFGPYNFPGHLPNGHIVPALIAGNTVVFKPSELTPLTAQFMVGLWQQAGIPKGVINLTQGEIDTGKALSANPDIDGLLFTGSASTGKLLHHQFAGQPEKILALEMGGNNPLIVRDCRDSRSLVYTIVQSAFITSGQRCTCARRLYIPQGESGDQLVRQLSTAAAAIVVGNPADSPEPFMGPVASAAAAKNLKAAYQYLVDTGGRALLEMKHLDKHTGLVTPGIVDVTGLELDDEEDFGPLLKMMRYTDFEAAIDNANNTRFGLAAGLLGGGQADYELFRHHIRAGIVNWNRQTTGASSNAPFGGIGISGNHRASAYYAADYCAYPVASLEAEEMEVPDRLPPGLVL